MSSLLMPATATGFFIASRRKGSPSSWLIIASMSVVFLCLHLVVDCLGECVTQLVHRAGNHALQPAGLAMPA